MLNKMVSVVAAITLGFFLATGVSFAADANTLVRQIDMQLKKAERMIRAGKDDRSKPFLTKAQQLIEDLKTVDATNGKLGGLEQRYNKMASSGAQKEKDVAGLKSDAQKAVDIHNKHHGKFEKVHGDHLVADYLNLDQVRQALKMIEDAEQTIPLFSSELGALMKKYGTTSGDIYNSFFKAGYKLTGGEEHKMEQMVQAMGNVQKSREATGRHLADKAKMLIDVFSEQLNDARLERMQKSKKLLALGMQIDPNNRQIQQMFAKADDQITQVADQMTAQIDAATWTESVTTFDGPGTVASLATQAKRYFENDRDWGKKPGRNMEVLKVSVTGPWKVAEKDAFGFVTRWRLPIHLAITDDKFKPRNIARVYDLSIVARKGSAGNAPKAPPFDGFWVGDNWMMRLDKL